MSRGHVLLVGAGHANLLVLGATPRLRAAGLGVTVVDPDAFWYSGMAAATGTGVVHPGRDRVDPAPLAGAVGAHHLLGRVTGLELSADPASPTGGRAVARLDTGRRVTATAVVVNVGSVVDPHGLPVHDGLVTPAKPTQALLGLRDRLLSGPPGARVVVVGNGASAVEIAGNLVGVGDVGRRAAPWVTVVGPRPLLPPADAVTRRHAATSLRRRGVRLDLGARVDDLVATGDRAAPVEVVLSDGRRRAADHVVLATGLRAHPTVERLGLGDGGGMPTRATLQHVGHDHVLGAGDAIAFPGGGLPRLGVHAVRQAPVLVDNLLALHAAGGVPGAYEPAPSHLTAVDLGSRDATLTWRGRTVTGWPALVAKRLLDEWFLRRHRVPRGSSGRDWRAEG